MSTRTTYGYWHNRAVDGKQVCNHYARQIGGECGHPDLGVWTPLVKQDKQVERDAIWLAHLASGSSWPGEMANAVQVAADRVVWEYGSDAERIAINGSDAERIAIKIMRGAGE